ncbi:MAG: hypothetical protein AVDCRST_MAG19-4599, partial [uncultured Thermomicrobiales bacterium]
GVDWFPPSRAPVRGGDGDGEEGPHGPGALRRADQGGGHRRVAAEGAHPARRRRADRRRLALRRGPPGRGPQRRRGRRGAAGRRPDPGRRAVHEDHDGGGEGRHGDGRHAGAV